jgi:hypothetical protein
MKATDVALTPLQIKALQNDPFYIAYRGHFFGILRWHQLDTLWEQLNKDQQDDWYLYAVGEQPPTETASVDALQHFIQEIDLLLRREHDEDYCGVVYADSYEETTFIKIFDPNNLGTSCGSSGIAPLPSWILSKIKPINLPSAFPQPANRKRWWKSLFR